jgi:hypothetical protein
VTRASEDLPRALELLEPDIRAVEEGRRRMEAVWRGERPDRLPIAFSSPAPELDDIHAPNSAEIQADPAAMLLDQVRAAVRCARAGSDAQITVRPNVGTPFAATLFGLESRTVEGSLPWLKEHLSKDAISAFELPDDLSSIPAMRRVLDLIAYFREELGDRARVFLADTQGPFDIAHLVRGEGIFLDLYDDPEFVDHLMGLATRMYVESTRLMRRATGEEDLGHAGYHMQVYMGRGTARACEDTTTLLSPEQVEKVAAPRTAEALAAVGEGWVHYCGSNPACERAFIEMDAVRGLNFGNPEMHDMPSVISRLAERGKVYLGGVPREEGEGLADYFRRVLEPTRATGRGLILQPALRGDEAANPARVLDEWAAANEGAGTAA